VSYVCIGDEQGARIGKQLVSDIRAIRTEAVSDHETITDERFMPFLLRELPQCGCLIVVQTPMALQSWRVQSTLALASTLIAQQQLRAIRVIAAPSENADEQPLWTALISFDASIDYLRAREKVFLVLGLTHIDADDSFIGPHPLSVRRPGFSVSRNEHLSPQPPGSIAGLVGSIWPTPPSTPAPRPIGSDWPEQAPISQQRDQPDSILKHTWFRIQAFVTRLWKRSQTSIAAHPGGFLRIIEAWLLRDDYPQSPDATHRFVIRWAIVTGVLLALILAVTLIAVLIRSHMPHQG
jgi:hypothetical protein